MSDLTLLLVLSAFAMGHCSFLIIILFLNRNKVGHQLLGILLSLLVLRIAKSIIAVFYLEGSFLFSVIGLIAMSAIGPVLLFYIKSLFISDFKIQRIDYLHFLGTMACILLSFSGNWKFLDAAYYLFTTHLLIYCIYLLFYLLKNSAIYQTDDIKWKWSVGIMAGTFLIWVTFAAQLFFYAPVIYQSIIITAAVVLYILSLWASRQSRLFMPDPRKKNDQEVNLTELRDKILKLFEADEIYIDPTLNITKLAKRLNTHPYLVSRTINQYFKKSFPELLVNYRIHKAEQLLLSSVNKAYTIEAIAYESGFNTLSAFYTAFKKINHVTPAQYRRDKGDSNLKIA